MEVISKKCKSRTVSVVIPVLNEEKYLGECLKALRENSVAPLEIFVVDGGSTDNTRKIAERMGAVVLNNPRGHAAGGRNVGIKEAKGEIIAFIDGDCIPDKNWIAEIKNAFEENVDGIGGYVEPAHPENLYEEFWGNLFLKTIMSYGTKDYYVSQKTLKQGFITANCAYTKEILYKLKGFNNWFANNAEDIDLTWRALDAGARLKYVSNVKIQAHSPTDLEGIKKKSFRDGYSSSKLQKKYGVFFNYDWNIYKALIINMCSYIKKRDIESKLMVVELLWHLAGKYYGSVKVRVINI